jgi:pyruvate dehydrogenase E2 component (dihydrolipoamide acetyltransferase)
MKTFRLPDLGEGLTEAEIVAWHVGEGDHVVADQPLVSVETQKAVVEIPAPQSGRITRLYGQAGDILPVGSPLAEFDGHDARDSETVVGELPHENGRPEVVTSAEPKRGAPRVKAAPAVRKLADVMGVDLATLTPSGKGGAVTAADVHAAASEKNTQENDSQHLRGPRRAMAKAMARAGRDVVRATVTAEADVSNWQPGEDIMVRLVRAMVAGCARSPMLNAWFDGEALSLKQQEDVNLGIAMDTLDGLFVPVLHNANRLEQDDIRPALDDLKRKVSTRSITPAGMEGASITLSNFGSLGGMFAELVVMPPQVAIIGAGRIQRRSDNEARMPLSLSFDHRAITGGEAMQFLNAVIGSLEASEGDVP